MFLSCIQLLIHITVFITYISWWITTPVSPEDICIFSQARKPLFSVVSEELAKLEKEWFECTWLIFPMRLCWTTAEYKWNVSACYCLEMYSPLPPTYMNCFQVCPPDLLVFVSSASFLTVATVLCLALVCGIVLRQWVHRNDFIIRPSDDTHPQHVFLGCLGYVSLQWQWLWEMRWYIQLYPE